MNCKLIILVAISCLTTPVLTAQKKATATGFEQNKGQVHEASGEPSQAVKYVYAKSGLQIFAMPSGLTYQFSSFKYPDGYIADTKYLHPEAREQQAKLSQDIRRQSYRIDMQLLGATANPKITTEGKSSDYTNYYNRSALNVHSYQKLTYHEVYPNIDWVIYVQEEGIKYDFIVRKGGNPNLIKLQFSDFESLKLNADGSFTLKNCLGELTENAPVSFQTQKTINTNFVLNGDCLSFDLGDYNKNETLVIDPNLVWATYYGSSNIEVGMAANIDNNGNTYIAGKTNSTNDIAQNGYQDTLAGDYDSYLVKFSPQGDRLWSTYYGGEAEDYTVGCATDANGNIFITGGTSSLLGIAYNTPPLTFIYERAAYLAKFDTLGAIVWGKYIIDNGAHTHLSYDCEVDNNNNVYIVFTTISNTNINTYTKLMKLDNDGATLWIRSYGMQYSNGQGPSTYGRDCATDRYGNVYIAGGTISPNIATANAHQTASIGAPSGFLIKTGSDGTLIWSTYYTDIGWTDVYACATDYAGNVYIGGQSEGQTHISYNGHQNATPNTNLAFLAKFNGNGVRQWGTYYNGQRVTGIAADNFGNVYAVGTTNIATGVADNGFQDNITGGYDAFIVKFNRLGQRQWGTYYGGLGDEAVSDCLLDGSAHLCIVGSTSSTSGIALGGFQNTLGGNTDAFLIKITTSQITNINEVTTSPNFSVYPNPTQGQLNINFGVEVSNIDLKVFDVAGRLCLQSNGISGFAHQIDTDFFAAGLYILQLSDNDGNMSNLKFVKK
jgi:hypothetical protein